MKTWFDVTLEDLALPEGGYDQEQIRKMNLVEYLEEIEDLIRMEINRDPICAPQQLDNVFVKLYMEQCRVVENRYPDAREIRINQNRPEVVDGIQQLLQISMCVDQESWPETKRELLELGGVEDYYGI